ncbi:MAG: hypothetical protein IPJ41_00580 [Phycisphaerales bacterium]|nr:hypothetical protein [Phycisphaerales bacterium]
MRTMTGLAGLGLLASVASGSVVFDFENLPGNSDRSAGDFIALSVQSQGLYALITRSSGEKFTVWNSKGQDVPDAWGSKHLSPTFNYLINDYLVMSFAQPVSAVSIDFGDYGQDDDLAIIEAYDEIHAGGNLLGSSTGRLGDTDIRWDDPTRISYRAAPEDQIWSIRFRGGLDPYLQSTFIDNITVDLVPTPGTLAGLGLAMATFAGRARRHRHQTI